MGLFSFGPRRYDRAAMPKSRPRPDWSRPLPRPLVIPNIMTLATLADVRTLIERHLPEQFRDKGIWRYAAATLQTAAQGRVAPAEVHAALIVAVELERVEWRPK